MPILQCNKVQKRNDWIVLRKWKSQTGSITYTTYATENIVRWKRSRFSHFLPHILKYNNCFRMTFFGASVIREGVFMPTSKIQGQIYHLQFLQIDFISSAGSAKCAVKFTGNTEAISCIV